MQKEADPIEPPSEGHGLTLIQLYAQAKPKHRKATCPLQLNTPVIQYGIMKLKHTHTNTICRSNKESVALGGSKPNSSPAALDSRIRI